MEQGRHGFLPTSNAITVLAALQWLLTASAVAALPPMLRLYCLVVVPTAGGPPFVLPHYRCQWYTRFL